MEGLKHLILNFLLDVLTGTASDVEGDPSRPGIEEEGGTDLETGDLRAGFGPRQQTPMQVHPLSQSTQEEADRNSGGKN